MLKPNESKSAYDFIEEKSGKIYENACPYFEGKEVCGCLNADNRIVDYELIVHINDNGTESDIAIPLKELFAQSNKLAALADKGLILQPYLAKDAFELLQADAQRLRRYATIKHKRLGLATINGQYVYLQATNTVGVVKYVYDGKIKLCGGSQQQYDSFLQTTVFNVRNLTLAYMIGMSAPVVSLLEQEGVVPYNAIFIDFAGKSSTGKSTLARLALSPFGSPSFYKDGLGFTFNSTDNGIYDDLDGIHGMPRVLDDINQNARLNMEQLIYSVASGEAKRRSGVKYQVNNSGWSGTIIATTETPIILDTAQKGGVHARVLTLELSQWTSSKEEAEQVNGVVRKNYGWTGQEFVAHLLDDIDYLKERFEGIRQEVDERITVRDTLTDRISAQIAAIALTADCYLRYYPNAFEWSYLDLIEPFIKGEEEMVGERDAGEKILEIIREYCSTNNALFNRRNVYENGKLCCPSIFSTSPLGEIIYIYDSGTKKALRQEVYIYANKFKSIIWQYRVNDSAAGLQQLKTRGLLKADKDGRFQTKLKGVRAYRFILDIQDDNNEYPIEDDDNA